MPKRRRMTSLGRYLSVVPSSLKHGGCQETRGSSKKKKLAMKEMKMRKMKLTKGPSLGISSLSYSVARKKVSKEKNET